MKMRIFKTNNTKNPKSNTGYNGICYRKRTNDYQVYIGYSNKLKSPDKKDKYIKINVGNFKTLKESIRAREEFLDNLY